jgi:voltage-gated potassium channel
MVVNNYIYTRATLSQVATINLYVYLRNIDTMGINNLYTYLKANINFVIPIGLVFTVIIFGGIGMYLVEHNRPGANITNLGNAFWWAVVTITTVGYGDYTPVTVIGRIIAVVVMFSGIGIVVTLLTLLSQRRLQHTESMLKVKLKTEHRPKLLGDEKKIAIKDEIDGIGKMTEKDFDRLIVMIKGLRRTVLEGSKTSYKCSRCSIVYYIKPRFCSNCGLELPDPSPSISNA